MFKSLAVSLGIVIFLAASVGAQDKAKQDAEPDPPKVGDQAPDWTLVGSDGKTYKLSSYKGKQGVVVAWYPAALTGG